MLDIVNTSLQSGFVPPSLKEAILKLVLKNFKLDYCEFMNFRPISNLAFLSKVVEKVVSKQIIQYIDLNKLNERYQSAYRAFHSTETALLKVYNEIAWSIDAGPESLLFLSRWIYLLLSTLSTTYSFQDCQLVMGSLVWFWSGSSHICSNGF